jgi:hypothetical protein
MRDMQRRANYDGSHHGMPGERRGSLPLISDERTRALWSCSCHIWQPLPLFFLSSAPLRPARALQTHGSSSGQFVILAPPEWPQVIMIRFSSTRRIKNQDRPSLLFCSLILAGCRRLLLIMGGDGERFCHRSKSPCVENERKRNKRTRIGGKSVLQSSSAELRFESSIQACK